MTAHRTRLAALLADIRACRHCAALLAHPPRPVLRASPTSRLCIVGQAPGTKVHATGIPFNDASGVRLREWLGLTPEIFYDETRVAIVPMGFCFPGQDSRGADLPPRPECAPLWRPRLFPELRQIKLTVLVGFHAQRWHLGGDAASTLTETVRNWRRYLPRYIPVPHPSWRNTGWLKKNPWFAAELLPELKIMVRAALADP